MTAGRGGARGRGDPWAAAATAAPAAEEAVGGWRAAVLDLRDRYAPVTVREAIARFGVFERWCVARGLAALPATPGTVLAYAEAVGLQLRPSMVWRRVRVVRQVHRLLGLADPGADLPLPLRTGAPRAGAALGFVRVARPAGAAPDDPPWLRAVKGLEGAYAPKTLRECARMFRAFEAWCDAEGRPALPAEPETLASYVAAISPRLVSTGVEARLAAIRRVHEVMGLPDRTRAAEVALAARRGKRRCAAEPRQAQGVTAETRDRLRAACPDTLIGLRDRAMISLGYDTLCRAFELVALRVEDIEAREDGTATIQVRRTKGALHEGRQIGFLSAAAIADVKAWTEAAGIVRGPILRPVCGLVVYDRAMAPRNVGLRLQAIAAAAGAPHGAAKGLSGHSLRVGAAQDLAVGGGTLLQLMRAGRWSSLQAVARYARAAPVNVWSPDD